MPSSSVQILGKDKLDSKSKQKEAKAKQDPRKPSKGFPSSLSLHVVTTMKTQNAQNLNSPLCSFCACTLTITNGEAETLLSFASAEPASLTLTKSLMASS